MIRAVYIFMNWLTLFAAAVGAVWGAWLLARLAGRYVSGRV